MFSSLISASSCLYLQTVYIFDLANKQKKKQKSKRKEEKKIIKERRGINDADDKKEEKN